MGWLPPPQLGVANSLVCGAGVRGIGRGKVGVKKEWVLITLPSLPFASLFLNLDPLKPLGVHLGSSSYSAAPRRPWVSSGSPPSLPPSAGWLAGWLSWLLHTPPLALLLCDTHTPSLPRLRCSRFRFLSSFCENLVGKLAPVRLPWPPQQPCCPATMGCGRPRSPLAWAMGWGAR